jgi:hypothetical protein
VTVNLETIEKRSERLRCEVTKDNRTSSGENLLWNSADEKTTVVSELGILLKSSEM